MTPRCIMVIVESQLDIRRCLEIRRAVFQQEQGIPYVLDRDGFDFDVLKTFHILAVSSSNQTETVGTVRGRILDRETIKLERMAILARFRRCDAGKALLRFFEKVAAGRGAKKIVLHAQEQAKGFYRRYGYEFVGAPFEEAGIMHYKMEKKIV